MVSYTVDRQIVGDWWQAQEAVCYKEARRGVGSTNRQPCLVSRENSAWCIFTDENNSYCSGLRVEFGDQELQEIKALRAWRLRYRSIPQKGDYENL